MAPKKSPAKRVGTSTVAAMRSPARLARGGAVKRCLDFDDNEKEPAADAKLLKLACPTEVKPDSGAEGTSLKREVSISASLGRATTVSAASRELLRRSLRWSLFEDLQGGCGRWQDGVAGLLCEVMHVAEEELACQLEKAAEKVETTKGVLGQGSERLLTAESAWRTSKASLDAVKARWGECNLDMQVARQALAVASAGVASSEQSLLELAKFEATLSISEREHYPHIQEGTAQGVGPHLAAFSALLSRVPLGESLTKAFAVAASKPAQQRGAFDQATLQQLHTDFKKYQASLATKIEAAASAVEAAKLKEKAANETLQQTRSLMGTASRELRMAEMVVLASEDGMCAAEEKRRGSLDAITLADVARHRLRQELEEFQAGPVASCDEICAKRRAEVATNAAKVTLEACVAAATTSDDVATATT
jgi:hypothetical protein